MNRKLVTLAHERRDAGTFEVGLLELLGSLVTFDAAYFTVKGLEAFPTAAGLAPEVVERAIAGAPTYIRELLPVKRAALERCGVAVDTQVLGARRVHETRYYSDLAASVGGQHSLMAYVPWRDRVVAAVMLGRSGSGFSNRDIRAVEELLPEIGVARAAFGWPVTFEPLGAAHSRGLLERMLPSWRASAVASARTSTHTLVVRDRAGFREMVARHGGSELVWTRAAIADPRQSGWPYIELFHVAAALAKQRRNALFVGCGGAVAPRQFAAAYPGIAIDIVESEAAVLELARAFYDLDGIPGARVHLADGVDFVGRAASASWDVAVIDAYDATELASGFAARSFFAALRRSLRPGGAAAFNVIGALRGDAVVRDVVNAARAELDELRILPVTELDEAYWPEAPRNIVVVGTRGN